MLVDLVLFLFLINIHYFVACSGHVVPGGCVFTIKSANVFVGTLFYQFVLDIYLCSVGYRMCHLDSNDIYIYFTFIIII